MRRCSDARTPHGVPTCCFPCRQMAALCFAAEGRRARSCLFSFFTSVIVDSEEEEEGQQLDRVQHDGILHRLLRQHAAASEHQHVVVLILPYLLLLAAVVLKHGSCICCSRDRKKFGTSQVTSLHLHIANQLNADH